MRQSAGMHIETVRLEDVSLSRAERRYCATLLIEGAEQRISFRAQAAMSRVTHRQEMTRLLVDDALRQLRRMPEYRNSARPITLAQGALPR